MNELEKTRTGPQAKWSTHQFAYEMEVRDDGESLMRRKLNAALPELTWVDLAETFGKIRLAGESGEKPFSVGQPTPAVAICLVRREAPGPFQLTITLHLAGPAGRTVVVEAYESHSLILAKVTAALCGEGGPTAK
jgi:hypothetical protein